MKCLFFKMLAVAVLLSPVLAAAGCSEGEEIIKPNPDSPGEPTDDPTDEPVYKDLSSTATANCYVVTAPGNYGFYASVQGNGAATEGIEPQPLRPVSAKVIWQTSPRMIEKVALDVTDITFTVSKTGGNALIGALDGEGRVVWSWHIWMPRAEPQPLAGTGGYTVMDMNLGALGNTVGSADSYGMLYQWGRKDPFPTAATLTGDEQTVGAPLYDAAGGPVEISAVPSSGAGLAFSVANPTAYISGSDWLEQADDNLWGNPSGAVRDEENMFPHKGSKSIYDPCPPGWRVPPADAFRNFTSSGGYSWVVDEFDIYDLNGSGGPDADDWNYGWVFNLSDGVTSYFPAAGRYYGAYGLLYGSVVGVYGNYWGNCPNGVHGYAVAAFQNSAEGVTCSPAAAAPRADGYSVRCVAEE